MFQVQKPAFLLGRTWPWQHSLPAPLPTWEVTEVTFQNEDHWLWRVRVGLSFLEGIMELLEFTTALDVLVTAIMEYHGDFKL